MGARFQRAFDRRYFRFYGSGKWKNRNDDQAKEGTAQPKKGSNPLSQLIPPMARPSLLRRIFSFASRAR